MDFVTNKVPCSISCCFNFGTLLGNPIILRLVKKKEKKKKSSICLRISLQNFLVNRILKLCMPISSVPLITETLEVAELSGF